MVFQDMAAVEWADDDHGAPEERYVTVGVAGHRLLTVVSTPRDERIRIISARLAEPYERRKYHNDEGT